MTEPAPTAPARHDSKSSYPDNRGFTESETQPDRTVPRSQPALQKQARAEEPSIQAVSLEGFGKRMEAIHGSSLWVAFKTAREISIALSPREWGLFLRLGDDTDFRYASGTGFKLPAGGGSSLAQDLVAAWPIAHRVAGTSLDALKRQLSLSDAPRCVSLDVLRFGDRSLFLSERRIEPRPSGTLEAAFAALGARLDPTLGRVIGKSDHIPCSPEKFAAGLSRKTRMLRAAHIVFASFEASRIRDSMAKEFGAEPASFMSLVSRVAASLLSETGGACAMPDSRLVIYVLTHSPPDPELLASQFATSLSRAVGGFERTDLPILRYHSVHSDEQGLGAIIESFLGSPKSRP